MAPSVSSDWIKPFRAQIRAVTSSGWFVKPDNHGATRLVIQKPGQPAQTASLPIPWAKGESGRILTEVQKLHDLMSSRGLELRTAIRVACEQDTGRASSWQSAAEGFERRMAANVKPVTWAKYAEVLALALEMMASRRPASSGIELLEAVIKKWEPGSRRRQQAAQQLARFLRYRIELRQLPADGWTPPERLNELVGVATRQKTLGTIPNKVTEMRDEEILALLESFPDTAAGNRWADCIRILAELGLRPHELQLLSVKIDPTTGKAHWWVSYEKRAGSNASTKERQPQPLALAGTCWNLLERWQLGDIKLPRLDAGNGAADSIRHYLMRRPVWLQLEAAYATRGENIAPYSFRNSWCLRANLAGLPLSAVADAMGNSPEVIAAKYTWASRSTTELLFQAVRDRATAPTPGEG
jgi:integrase